MNFGTLPPPPNGGTLADGLRPLKEGVRRRTSAPLLEGAGRTAAGGVKPN